MIDKLKRFNILHILIIFSVIEFCLALQQVPLLINIQQQTNVDMNAKPSIDLESTIEIKKAIQEDGTKLKYRNLQQTASKSFQQIYQKSTGNGLMRKDRQKDDQASEVSPLDSDKSQTTKDNKKSSRQKIDSPLNQINTKDQKQNNDQINQKSDQINQNNDKPIQKKDQSIEKKIQPNQKEVQSNQQEDLQNKNDVQTDQENKKKDQPKIMNNQVKKKNNKAQIDKLVTISQKIAKDQSSKQKQNSKENQDDDAEKIKKMISNLQKQLQEKIKSKQIKTLQSIQSQPISIPTDQTGQKSALLTNQPQNTNQNQLQTPTDIIKLDEKKNEKSETKKINKDQEQKNKQNQQNQILNSQNTKVDKTSTQDRSVPIDTQAKSTEKITQRQQKSKDQNNPNQPRTQQKTAQQQANQQNQQSQYQKQSSNPQNNPINIKNQKQPSPTEQNEPKDKAKDNQQVSQHQQTKTTQQQSINSNPKDNQNVQPKQNQQSAIVQTLKEQKDTNKDKDIALNIDPKIDLSLQEGIGQEKQFMSEGHTESVESQDQNIQGQQKQNKQTTNSKTDNNPIQQIQTQKPKVNQHQKLKSQEYDFPAVLQPLDADKRPKVIFQNTNNQPSITSQPQNAPNSKVSSSQGDEKKQNPQDLKADRPKQNSDHPNQSKDNSNSNKDQSNENNDHVNQKIDHSSVDTNQQKDKQIMQRLNNIQIKIQQLSAKKPDEINLQSLKEQIESKGTKSQTDTSQKLQISNLEQKIDSMDGRVSQLQDKIKTQNQNMQAKISPQITKKLQKLENQVIQIQTAHSKVINDLNNYASKNDFNNLINLISELKKKVNLLQELSKNTQRQATKQEIKQSQTTTEKDKNIQSNKEQNQAQNRDSIDKQDPNNPTTVTNPIIEDNYVSINKDGSSQKKIQQPADQQKSETLSNTPAQIKSVKQEQDEKTLSSQENNQQNVPKNKKSEIQPEKTQPQHEKTEEPNNDKTSTTQVSEQTPKTIKDKNQQQQQSQTKQNQQQQQQVQKFNQVQQEQETQQTSNPKDKKNKIISTTTKDIKNLKKQENDILFEEDQNQIEGTVKKSKPNSSFLFGFTFNELLFYTVCLIIAAFSIKKIFKDKKHSNSKGINSSTRYQDSSFNNLDVSPQKSNIDKLKSKRYDLQQIQDQQPSERRMAREDINEMIKETDQSKTKDKQFPSLSQYSSNTIVKTQHTALPEIKIPQTKKLSTIEMRAQGNDIFDETSQGRKQKSLPQISTSPVGQGEGLRSIRPLKKPTNKSSLQEFEKAKIPSDFESLTFSQNIQGNTYKQQVLNTVNPVTLYPNIQASQEVDEEEEFQEYSDGSNNVIPIQTGLNIEEISLNQVTENDTILSSTNEPILQHYVIPAVVHHPVSPKISLPISRKPQKLKQDEQFEDFQQYESGPQLNAQSSQKIQLSNHNQNDELSSGLQDDEFIDAELQNTQIVLFDQNDQVTGRNDNVLNEEKSNQVDGTKQEKKDQNNNEIKIISTEKNDQDDPFSHLI